MAVFKFGSIFGKALARQAFKGQRGNALIEYVVPAGIFAVGVAIITTTADTNNLLAGFFASGSGETTEAIQDGHFITKPMGLVAGGWQGNGGSNFTPSGSIGASGSSPNPITGVPGGDSISNPNTEEVQSLLENATTPQDIYSAIENASLPSGFKNMVKDMGAENANADSLQQAMLLYAANPQNAAALGGLGGEIMQKLLGDSATGLSGASGNDLSSLASAMLLKNINPDLDPSDPKAAALMQAMQNGASMGELQMMNAAPDAAQLAEEQAQSNGACKNATQCNSETQRLVEALRLQIQSAPAAPSDTTTPTSDDPATTDPTGGQTGV